MITARKGSLRGVYWAIFALLLLDACAPSFNNIRVDNIPITLSYIEDQKISIESVIEDANTQVQEYVPGAYASDLTFLGNCKSLSGLDGTLNIIFFRAEKGKFYNQIIVGTASINMSEQVMHMHFEDRTEQYPSTKEPPILSENMLSLQDVAVIAQQHLDSLSLSNCDTTLNYIEDYWLITCTEPGSGALGAQIYEFRIDSATLEIVSE